MLKKIIFGFLAAIALLIFLILIQSVDPVQYDPQKTVFTFPDSLVNYSFDADSLRRIAGDNKGVPEGYEVAALLAYAAYPQLKDVAIDMQLINSGAPMESNFDIPTLFGPKKNRKYIIYLNDAPNTPFNEILLRSLPFDSQVGILAHELGHVAYYHQLSTLQIAKWGIMYLLSEDFRAKNEQTTDLMPVYHGLGNQIYQYAWYVRYDSCCSALYEKYGDLFMDKFYLSDKQLKDAIQNHKLYREAK